jgi:hypothetical protein
MFCGWIRWRFTAKIPTMKCNVKLKEDNVGWEVSSLRGSSNARTQAVFVVGRAVPAWS